jgi:catalase
MIMQDSPTAAPTTPRNRIGAWLLIAGVVVATAGAFAYVGGWLTPDRLTPGRLVDQLQDNAGTFAGFRRNHAKGVCVSGWFDSNGAAQAYSVAQVFAPGRTPVEGRFAIPGGNPYAADSGVPIRSMALRFTQANGQQWRTGMNSMPVFAVGTPEAFYAQLRATQPTAETGKPDPARVAAFFAAHPETGPFRAWVKTAKPSASYATESYWSLNAFVLTDVHGKRHAVRWRMVPEAAAMDAVAHKAGDADYLAADLFRRLAQGPQRWQLQITLANPGDPTHDASKAWPDDRRTIAAGTLVLDRTESQDSGSCRDINFDPLVLPDGIAGSDDPLLAARSAVYANSYLRRTSEEAHLPGTPTSQPQPGGRP